MSLDHQIEAKPSAQNTSLWITSLAVSVIFCAFFFLIFATYLLELKKSMAIIEIRFETQEQRIGGLTNDVADLRRQLLNRPAPLQAAQPAIAAPIGEVPTNINTGGVNVVRGQLPANAAINAQPAAAATPSDLPKIAVPTVGTAAPADAALAPVPDVKVAPNPASAVVK